MIYPDWSLDRAALAAAGYDGQGTRLFWASGDSRASQPRVRPGVRPGTRGA